MFRPRLRVGLLTVIALALSGCATTMERNGIANARLAATAEVPRMPGVRFWADEVPRDPLAEIKHRTAHMPPIARDAKRINGRKVIETLALSGGGSDGAFGAGAFPSSPSASFGQVTAVNDPRSLQLALRVRF